MKWGSGQRSDNVIDARGGSSGGRGGLGLGAIAVIVIIGLFLGKSPTEMLGLIGQMGGMQTGNSTQVAPAEDDQGSDFVRAILGETEVVWAQQFRALGQRYTAPKLVLFSGSVASACGHASAAMGPFYCPGDQRAYLDMSFFDDMRRSLGGGGEFAYAYVIAHEIGHHVQTLLGVSDAVNQARRRGQKVEGDGGLLVRQELQADCFAGLWAQKAEQRLQWLESGDIERALATATAIGDDRLQKQARGSIVPDAFTHGTSAQRVRWFRIGFEGGDIRRCDTFAAKSL